ncbi:hypothetical protein [Kitasatospora mediocidica]|uniref:hypothetical protein n=1 Tax=Kitasatospora mediocidica TaxID=58352 RepID=UPI000559D841|nr:hypothetical protein [Kitasatospora mediocidica]
MKKSTQNTHASGTPAPASTSGDALAAAADRFVASADASYDERTDLIQNLRVTAAQLAKAEQQVLDAPGQYRVADDEAGR